MHLVTRARSHNKSWFVFVLLLLCYAYFFPRWADWNQNSRLDLVLAVVDRGTLAIDDYYQNTGDYALYNGHHYSDKAPGTSFLGIPVYWFFKSIAGRPLTENLLPRIAANPALASTQNPAGAGLLFDKAYYFVVLTVVTFFVVALPSALLGVLFYRLLGHFSENEWHRVGLTFVAGLATPALAYANNFYGHQVAAFLLFAAFYLLFRMSVRAGPADVSKTLLVVGLLLGCSLITEYPVVLIVGGMCVYALYRVRDWRKIGILVVGMILPLCIAAAYNFSIFGTPLPVGYEYSELWQETHRVGVISLTYPTIEALWGITLSPYRGLFFISPFLLLAFPGLYYFWREKKYRPEFWVATWSVTSFFLFNASSAMWSGGFAVGPRYLVPMLPFLALPILFLLKNVHVRWVQSAAYLLALASLGLCSAQYIAGQSFPQYQSNPLFEYSLAHLLSGDIARNWGMVLGLAHWSSLLPLLVLVGAIAMVYVTLDRLEPRMLTIWAGKES